MIYQVRPGTGRKSSGIAQLFSGLDLTETAPTKTKKPGILSADGTDIIRTDTLSLQSKERQKAKDAQKKLYAVRLGNQWRSSAVRAYMRLARAHNQQQCKSVAASASQQAAQLKRALSLGDENRVEVQAVLAQMQKAVMRAKLKGRQLDEEQVMQRQARRAEEQQQKAKALYLEIQRQKKTVVRQVRESGYVRESVVARYQAAERVQQQLAAQAAAPALPGSPAVSLGVGGATGAVSVEAAGPAAPVVVAPAAVPMV